jgi:phosphatidylinositol alpha 1,6-mannosyltransferase
MIHRIIAVLEDIVVGLSSQQMRHGPEHSSGRLAAEKVRRLAELSDLGYRVVVVGDGPDRVALESSLPSATFLGMRSGADLATERGRAGCLRAHRHARDPLPDHPGKPQASGVAAVGPAVGVVRST